MQFHIVIVIGIVFKVHFGIAMTIDTPTHRQITILTHNIHLLNLTVTLLAIHLGNTNMLRMTEKYMIRQIMNPSPFYRFFGFVGFNHLGNLKFSRMGSFPYQHMAIHTQLHGWYSGRFTKLRGMVTIFTVNLIIAGMYFMRKLNGLIGSCLLYTSPSPRD